MSHIISWVSLIFRHSSVHGTHSAIFSLKFCFCEILCVFMIRSQGCEVSVKEVDTLMSLLAEKKRKMEQEEAERNMQILLDFLHCLRKQKVDELSEVRGLIYKFQPC